MVLVVPKNHPWSRLKTVRAEALREQGFISREGGSGTLRSLRALMSRKGKDPEKFLHVIMELGSTEAVKEAVIAGLGISVLSATSVQREIHDGLLQKVDIRGLKLQRDFYEVIHRTRVLSPASEAFRNFIRED
jgi:DNA-binding transcriptional LysR family regulator